MIAGQALLWVKSIDLRRSPVHVEVYDILCSWRKMWLRSMSRMSRDAIAGMQQGTGGDGPKSQCGTMQHGTTTQSWLGKTGTIKVWM